MVFPGAHNLPLYLMDDVEIIYTKSRNEQIAAIQSEQVDIIHTSPDNLFLSDAYGLVPFLAGTVGPLSLVRRGKSDRYILAVDNPKSGFGLLAYKFLQAQRPDIQYEIKAVGGTAQRFEALMDGTVNLAVMHPPFTQMSQQMQIQFPDAGYAIIGRIDQGYPTLCGVVHNNFADGAKVERYKKMYRNAIQVLAGDDGDSIARRLIKEHIATPEDTIAEISFQMRDEIIHAGVEFDPDSLFKLKALREGK